MGERRSQPSPPLLRHSYHRRDLHLHRTRRYHRAGQLHRHPDHARGAPVGCRQLVVRPRSRRRAPGPHQRSQTSVTTGTVPAAPLQRTSAWVLLGRLPGLTSAPASPTGPSGRRCTWTKPQSAPGGPAGFSGDHHPDQREWLRAAGARGFPQSDSGGRSDEPLQVRESRDGQKAGPRHSIPARKRIAGVPPSPVGRKCPVAGVRCPADRGRRQHLVGRVPALPTGGRCSGQSRLRPCLSPSRRRPGRHRPRRAACRRRSRPGGRRCRPRP
ncbi:hypothetical protein SMICM304S_03747 [Streptomyces microflavus]